MKPSIGRIVHYVSYGTPGDGPESQCCAAIVTDMLTDVPAGDNGSGGEKTVDVISLCVLNPTGFEWVECVQDEETKAGGSWHWPERVD